MPAGELEQSSVRSVVKEQQTKNQRQQVEETVTPRQGDQQHQDYRRQPCRIAKGRRREKQQWNEQFDDKQNDGGRLMKPGRKLMEIPGHAIRQRLGFIMMT